MIKRKKSFIKNLLLSAVLLVCMCVNAAASDSEWNLVYTQSFDGAPDAEFSTGITNESYSFSAQIKDEKLVMKSDALCYFRVQNPALDSLNSAENSHGISVETYGNRWVCSELAEPSNGAYYSGSNTNALLVKEQGGLNSLGTVLVKTNSGVTRTNIMFDVDSSLFESTDGITIKIKYYTPDGYDRLRITYPNRSGSSSTSTVYDTGRSGSVDTWHTVTKALDGADFTRNAHSDYTFSLTANQTGTNGEGMVFIHSVELYKTAGSVVDEDAENTVFKQEIAQEQIYGNAKLTYDLTFPTDIPCAEACGQDVDCIVTEYNTGNNMVSFSLTDSNSIEFASIQYELEGTVASIYALSTNAGGDAEKNLLYNGNIADTQLTYTVTLNMKESTYTVSIENSGEPLALENNGPFTVYNKEDVGLYCNAKYIKINHNQSSKALLYEIDNIKVESQVDEDYEAAATDLDNIVLESVVKNDFTLPVQGDINESEIQWASFDSAITIVGNTAFVSRGEEDITVRLLAEATINGMTAEKEFYVTVKSWNGIYFEVPECYGEIESDGTISAGATVMHPGVTGATSITFAVFSIDSTTGKICNVEYDTKPVISTYGEMSFTSISGMASNGGNTVKCYLWDNNNKSLINNKPVVRELSAESKVKGAGLSWKGYDDNNAIEYYEIYRNGIKIAEVPSDGSDMRYVDASVVGKNNSYSVIPVDTNLNKGEEAVNPSKCGKIPMTYYLTPIGESEAEINGNGSGITMILRTSETGAGYTEYDVNGRKIPNGKYIPLVISGSAPKSDLVFKFTYKAEAGTKLQFLYNYQTMENTGDTYTVKASDMGKGSLEFVVKLPDITLESNNGKMNNAHFALQALNGSILLEKVEMIELSKYE